MDTIGNILKDNDTKPEEKLPVCKFCGKPYIWYKKELFSGENKRLLKVPVANCKCYELNEKEKERQAFLRCKSEKLAKLFDNSMITPLFKEKNFKNLSPTIELLKCQEYAKLFNPKNSLGIQMVGKVGTGKTTLLAAICNELMEKGYSCLFTTFSSLLDKFSRYSYENAGDITPLINWLVSFDFVVLDDLGRETYTDKRKETAFRIIDALLNYKVVTAFTANPEMLTKLKVIPEWNATLDRLKEVCKYHFEFKGDSLRGVEILKEATTQANLVG